MIKYILSGFIIFFILFPIKFSGIPISMNRLMGILGLIPASVFVLKNFFPPSLDKVFKGFLFLLLIGILTTIINQNFDEQFYMFIITPILNILACFLVCQIWGNEISLAKICDTLIIVQAFQALLSFAFFLIPSLAKDIYSYIDLDIGTYERLSLIQYRLMGIGNYFFHAAATYGTSLIILVFLPNIHDSIIYKHRFIYWSIVTLMTIAGILSARTFIFVIIPIFLYTFITRSSTYSFIKNILKTFLILSIIGLLFAGFYFMEINQERKEIIKNWAFELYENYDENRELRTSSSDHVISMYDVTPTNVKTWMIGDAQYTTKEGYYKATDIGYLRHIFYWGLIGTALFWLIIIIYYKETSKLFRSHEFSIFLLSLFLWDMILNFKGIISLASFYLCLFYVYGIMANIKKSTKYHYYELSQNISYHTNL